MPSVPYRGVTGGLLRLITVSRNCCSTAPHWPGHVVPKLTINPRRNLLYELLQSPARLRHSYCTRSRRNVFPLCSNVEVTTLCVLDPLDG